MTHPGRPFVLATLVTLVALAGVSVRAEEPAPVYESWETALLNGQKAGHVHFTVREVSRDDQTMLLASRTLLLRLKRGDDVAEIRATATSEETADGDTREMTMAIGLGRQQQLDLKAEVDGRQIRVSAAVGGKPQEPVVNPFPEGTIGLVGEFKLFTEKKPQPGSSFTYRYFEPQVSAVVTVNVEVGQVEAVELPTGEKPELLKIVSEPEKIGGVQLPPSTLWLDPESFEPRMTTSEMPGLGQLTLLRTTREVALAPFVPKVDAFNQSVRLGNRIVNVHRMARVVYRIALPEDRGDGSPLPEDLRQRIAAGPEATLEVTVDAVRLPAAVEAAEPAGDEFLASNMFIKSDDPEVIRLSRVAVGDEADPWRKAQRIEAWVNRNMNTVDFSEALATADHVARTLRGDCTEFSMLSAAMCRAAGVPSRTAVGVVYAEPDGRPVMAFHMWTEVYVRGQWLALDATLGQGSVGPGHIKITDHSWHEKRDFTPLLPVMRFLMGKPRIDILKVYYGQ